jgi:cytochrome c556
LALSGLLIAAPLLATPADSVKSRIAELRELGASYKAVNDGLRSPMPQTMLIQISARQIVNASKAQYGWFPAGSGAEAGVKTAAKPEIWTQAAKFKAAQNAFAAQAQSFQRAAAGGNIDAMRAEAKKLGLTCKGCHDSFRVPGT